MDLKQRHCSNWPGSKGSKRAESKGTRTGLHWVLTCCRARRSSRRADAESERAATLLNRRLAQGDDVGPELCPDATIIGNVDDQTFGNAIDGELEG